MNNLPDRASKYLVGEANYDKFPYVAVTDSREDCIVGWKEIGETVLNTLKDFKMNKRVVVVEAYQGVLHEEVLSSLTEVLSPEIVINTADCFLEESVIAAMIEDFMGPHPIFGRMNDLTISSFLDLEKVKEVAAPLESVHAGIVLVYGTGASLITEEYDLLIYADMARWEIQQRMRNNQVDNLGFKNRESSPASQYKQAYFVDWRACDLQKKVLMESWDFVLDTNDAKEPKMVLGSLVRKGLELASERPFRVVPFFDPGVWGGQWMREICDLDEDEVNYAWCFDCVPEENSLLLGFGDRRFEIPAIDLVFAEPEDLLGAHIFETFGAEFPIRFDFLDTMEGGNLSLQVHPFKAYMKEHFGLDYTQDESYYFLEAEEDAVVYLGVQNGVDKEAMARDLEIAKEGGAEFMADQYVNKFSVKKHDHVLIPAGTIHCSGSNSMVLEISATPYIFTFKLWDWGRVDLNGLPRTISLEHGLQNIDWDRTEDASRRELVNVFEVIEEGNGWLEERTGLHSSEFIETRRHWFTHKVHHHTKGNLNVLNLIEGREAIVESPDEAFEPFVVHYAETFIVPAAVGPYTIRPYGEGEGQRCGTLKAFVR